MYVVSTISDGLSFLIIKINTCAVNKKKWSTSSFGDDISFALSVVFFSQHRLRKLFVLDVR